MITINGKEQEYRYIPYPKVIEVDGKKVSVKSKEEHEALVPKKEIPKKKKKSK